MDPGISFFCSNEKGYLPIPPRAWSRVQNSCSLISGSDVQEFIQVPYSKKIVPYEQLGANIAMLRKGNVLQYKKNSSNLTKQQIYSLIAKGQWTNRTTTWATQSDRGYTNPNNQSYIRVGATNVTLDGAPTFLPVTCPRFPIINNGVLPAIAGGGTQNNVLPPPVLPAPNAGGSVIPLVPVAPVEPIVIQDFGNLVCGTYENLCTGEIIEALKLDNCHPTTDSDVPGPIQELCWNDGNPTWYPRQQYVMTNSTDKWPVNAQLGSAIIFDAPALSVSVLCNVVTLSWTFDPFYTSFNIYQDGLIIATVNGFINTYNPIVYNPGTYSFYIKGVNGNIESEPSNTASVTIDPPPAPTNLIINTICNVATLTWSDTSPCILTYQVYENGALIATTPDTSLNNITFDTVGPYDFYVIALLGSIQSEQSIPVSTTIFITPTPVLTVTTVCNIATLDWTPTPSPVCPLTYQLYANDLLITPTTTNTTDNFTLQDNVQYNFYVVAFLGSIASAQSTHVTVTYVPYYLTPPIISGLVYTVSFAIDTYTYTFTSGTGTVTFTDITNVISGSTTVIGGGGKGGNGGDGDINTGGGGGGGGGSGAENISAFLPVINTNYNVTIGGSTADSIFDSITSNHGGNGGNGQGTPFFSGGSPGSKGTGGTDGVDGQGGGSGGIFGGVGGDGGGAVLLSYGKGGNGGNGGEPFEPGKGGALGNNGVVILSLQLSC